MFATSTSFDRSHTGACLNATLFSNSKAYCSNTAAAAVELHGTQRMNSAACVKLQNHGG
jgi:hypothetical protein